MANTPALDKAIISFQLPISLKVRLEREAALRRMSVSALITHLINEGVAGVTLSAEDYARISKLVKQNEQRRKQRRK